MTEGVADGRSKVALVTGASRGIGAATARRLAEDGMDLVLAARSQDALDVLAGDIEASGKAVLAVPTDVGDTDAVEALIVATADRFGRLDVLVNNAGVLPPAARSQHVDAGDFRRMLDVNVVGPFHLSCLARNLMVGRGAGGVVVNVASTAAFYPSVGFAVYNATKAALAMLTRTTALEWAGDGVRVLGVAPGKIETALVQPILDYSARTGRPLNPQGRIGRPEEVADLIAFLVSDRAAYMTGTIVTIDGGEVVGSGADLAR